MDGTTETLLIILITLISTLIIISLAALTATVIAINMLIKKVQLTTDLAAETLTVIRDRVAKPVGIIGSVRHIYKIARRKKK